MEEKTCTNCKIAKPLSQFSRGKRTLDGLQYRCRACFAEYNRKRYAEKGEHLRAQMKAGREARREKGPFVCPRCSAVRPVLHKHRVVPGFMGGTYEGSNVVQLCANCHEDAHRVPGMETWSVSNTPEIRAKRSEIMRRVWRERDRTEWVEHLRQGAARRRGFTTPKQVEANRETARKRVESQLAEHGWSSIAPACLGCGTSEKPHKARGYCSRCYLNKKRAGAFEGEATARARHTSVDWKPNEATRAKLSAAQRARRERERANIPG